MINVINIFISNYKVNFYFQFIPLLILGISFMYIKESPYILYK